MTAASAASIRARLKRIADASGEDFQRVLERYGLERLLYRVSTSKHAHRYVLKGALLFTTWFDSPHRATRDADFLGYGPDDVASSEQAFRDLAEMPVQDGLVIDPGSVRGREIRLDQGYGGVRIEMNAELDGARIKLQADIGFGDAVTPAPEEIEFPVLLDDLPTPRLRAYPRATVIAEKLHAVCVLGIANSRMKDYFDLLVLVREGLCDDVDLATAVAATFRRRGTPVPRRSPVGLSREFSTAPGKSASWKAFLQRNRLQGPDLDATIHELARALVPALNRAAEAGDNPPGVAEPPPRDTRAPAAAIPARQTPKADRRATRRS